jgi:hypothetical protein
VARGAGSRAATLRKKDFLGSGDRGPSPLPENAVLGTAHPTAEGLPSVVGVPPGEGVEWARQSSSKTLRGRVEEGRPVTGFTHQNACPVENEISQPLCPVGSRWKA